MFGDYEREEDYLDSLKQDDHCQPGNKGKQHVLLTIYRYQESV